MNVLFLTEDTIDEILETYLINKNTMHKLLENWVDMSREILTNHMSLYSADLNMKAFYSEKGLKDRKQRIKYKFISTKNKENNWEEFVETKDNAKKEEGKNFFGNVSDYDRWFNILCLHNTKVRKILTTAIKAHEDRQSGVASNSSQPPKITVTKKKKKTKKHKKVQPIDVIVKFKSEDGHVEEIVIKDNGKYKINYIASYAYHIYNMIWFRRKEIKSEEKEEGG